jgi:hypothetical protein
MKIIFLVFAAIVFFGNPAHAQGRQQATASVTIYVDGASGNDANLGTSSGTGAKQHICAAISSLYADWDMRYNNVYVKVAGGQTYNEQCWPGSQLTGINVLNIGSSNNSNFTWANANTCLQFGDNAEIVIQNVTFACNTNNVAGQAAIYLHNNAVGDVFGAGIVFSGGGDKDTAVYCDGPCIFTLANGAQFQGRFRDLFAGDHHMSATVSGLITFAGNAFIDRMYRLSSLSTINASASYNNTGLYSMGASTVTGNSVLSMNGVAIPGGVTSSSGGQVCGGQC